ncbi:unnamed protein product [Trichogramma brassicae]|uniref:Uncharacterized protein n=1 Tax=Trichogramma brassicae TaxID=86971 RepID=A0A6H5J7N4_9HYME|nr:unnamed protein product [Trichogramma brassicae]
MGNLTFYSENDKEIVLWNILAAEGIADNLLSLRKFADAGYGIFLDNKELKIFNKKTGEIHIRGVYREPNWIIVRVMRQTAREGVSAMSRSPYQCEPYVRVWKRAAVDEATARGNSHDSLSPFHASTCVSLPHSTENLAAKQSSTREFSFCNPKYKTFQDGNPALQGSSLTCDLASHYQNRIRWPSVMDSHNTAADLHVCVYTRCMRCPPVAPRTVASGPRAHTSRQIGLSERRARLQATDALRLFDLI